jgi:hypothetical protein
MMTANSAELDTFPEDGTRVEVLAVQHGSELHRNVVTHSLRVLGSRSGACEAWDGSGEISFLQSLPHRVSIMEQ